MARARILIAALVTLLSAPLAGVEAAGAKPPPIEIAYVPPQNPAHKPLYERLMRNRALERMQATLTPFRLPRRLSLKIEGCNGSSDAWYEDGSITVCYEYLDEIWQKVPTVAGEDTQVSPIDALVGPFVEVFLHEFSHALFELLDLPVLGREEDAADQVAAYLMLQLGKDESPRLIRGAAHVFRTQMRQSESWPLQAFSDVHGTPAQRYYNLLCIAYGADRELFHDLAAKELPKERADGCEHEYRQIASAYDKLIRPHDDEQALRKVLSAKLLPDIRSRPPCYKRDGEDQPPEACPPEQWIGPGWGEPITETSSLPPRQPRRATHHHHRSPPRR